MSARILVIDDDPPSLALVEYLLRMAGYTTLTATNGGSGARLAVQARPDLVICDSQMPVMSGFQMLAQLQKDSDWRRVPLISLTAASMPGDRERALHAGFDGYISKPITPETFVEQIEAFLPPDMRVKRPPPAG